MDRNAIRYHVSPVKEKLLTTYYHNGQYKIFDIRRDSLNKISIEYSPLQKSMTMVSDTSENHKKVEELNSKIDKNYFFQSLFKDQIPLANIKDVSTSLGSNVTKYPF